MNACGILYVKLLKSMLQCPIEAVERNEKAFPKKNVSADKTIKVLVM